ncbi:MAG: ATP-binding cassette domain-containing protein [Candidatus Helarchaeota archaeon]
MEYFIEISNLTKKYKLSNGKIITALKNINLKIAKGEFFGLFGKSGAGKTTLVRILRGVENFNEGTVRINGINLFSGGKTNKLDVHKLKTISSIHLQRNFGLWADSVLHNVMRRLNVITYGSELVDLPDLESDEYNKMKKKALYLLKIVGLDQKAEWFSGILSGGEKQRLVLARQLALVGHNLQLLLLDEPLTMSDTELKNISIKYIKKIAKENEITVIITSHIPIILESICDRIAILEHGIIKDIVKPEGFSNKISQVLIPSIKLPSFSKKKVIMSIEDLDHTYYSPKIKKIFSLKIPKLEIFKGEILGILGRSGIGKTVLLRILAGVEMIKHGKIFYHSDKLVNIYNLSQIAMKVRNKINLMHQELDLEYYANVKDLILSKMGLKGETAIHNAIKKAKKLGIKENIVDIMSRLGDLPLYEVNAKLEKLGLDHRLIRDLFPIPSFEAYEKIITPLFNEFELEIDILERRTKELSWGEKVRIALILQLLSKPEILLLDEPFGDLEPIITRKITNFLVKINSDFNTTIIIATHNAEALKNCTHRILLLKHNKDENYTTIDKIINSKTEIEKIIREFSLNYLDMNGS